jgi:alpha-beta hydrolase superfamily lysophospholipase
MTPSATFHFTSSDGLSIACARWNGGKPTHGVVQLAHGMGEHMGRYARTIEALAWAGLTVYANDHRGHGLTAGRAANLGRFGKGGFELLVADMARLTAIARKENPGRPLVLLGHSMGSFAAQSYVIDRSRDIDALVLSGSGALDGLAEWARSVPPTRNILNAAFEPARTPFDWLSRDSASVDAFMSDPLCFAKLQPDAAASFLGMAERLRDPANLSRIRCDLPVYLFSGSEDPVGQQLAGVQRLIARYRDAGLRSITRDFYPGGRHEMLNEVNRRHVVARLVRWIAHVLGQATHPGLLLRDRPSPLLRRAS